MNTLYFECYSGISGDMTVASLLDLGADRKVLEDALASLHVDGYEIKIGRTFKCGIDACDFDVILDESAYVHDHGEHDHEHEHEHHHHDHDHDHHEHHHDHDGCSCGHHHTQEELDAIHAELGCEGACNSCDLCDTCLHSTTHHHHDADEVFTSWGRETPRKYSREELQDALASLAMSEDYGYILRAKGMVPCDDGQTWLHFDLVPEEFQIREGAADYTGRLCVIGSDLKEDQLEKLFLLA